MSTSKAFKQGFMDKLAEIVPSVSNDPELQYDPEALEASFDAAPNGLTEEQADARRKYFQQFVLGRALEGGAPLSLPYPRPNDSNPEHMTTGQYLGSILDANVRTPWRGFRSPEDSAGAALAKDLFSSAEDPARYKPETKYPFDNNVSNFVNRAVFDQLKTPATPAQTNNLYRALQTGIGK